MRAILIRILLAFFFSFAKSNIYCSFLTRIVNDSYLSILLPFSNCTQSELVCARFLFAVSSISLMWLRIPFEHLRGPQCAFHDHHFYSISLLCQFVIRPYVQIPSPNPIAMLYSRTIDYLYIYVYIYTHRHTNLAMWLLTHCYENGNVSRVPLNSSPSIFPTHNGFFMHTHTHTRTKPIHTQHLSSLFLVRMFVDSPRSCVPSVSSFILVTLTLLALILALCATLTVWSHVCVRIRTAFFCSLLILRLFLCRYCSGKQQQCYSILINIFDLRWDFFLTE